MKRRTAAIGGVVVVLAVVATAAATLTSHHHRAAAADGPTDASPPPTAQVTRRDLVQTTSVSGTLGYGSTTAVKASGSTGTVTGLAPVGSVVAPGQSLYEVDGRPTAIVMVGTRPMWRTLQEGVDDGPDVQQLEQNLVTLGYADPAKVTVDDHFSAATASAVKALQALHGQDDTGRVDAGDIWFTTGPVRVAAHDVALGDPASGSILETTATTRQVHVDLDASQGLVVTPLEKVTVTLNDGREVDGLVASVGTTATTTTNGNASTTTIPVDINLAEDGDAPDDSPVTVAIATSTAKGVLAVPVKALLALAEGGYALQRVKSDGTTELVAVTPGSFAGGFVEITGDVAEGDTVVTA
jgi:peptidoglycan hydrolase-like protein with peptidoglycan-binding domain